MNIHQLTLLQKLKSSMNRFRSNHPKFPLFLKAVSQKAITEGTIIEINVITPDEEKISTNIRLNKNDIDLFHSLKSIL